MSKIKQYKGVPCQCGRKYTHVLYPAMIKYMEENQLDFVEGVNRYGRKGKIHIDEFKSFTWSESDLPVCSAKNCINLQ